MDVVSIVRVVISRIPIIVVLATIAAIIVGVVVYKSPRKYRSETRLSTGYTVVDRFSLTQEGLNQFKTDLKFKNLIANIKSPTILQTLSYRLLLHDLEEEDAPFSKFMEDKEDNWIQDNYLLSKDTIKTILRDRIASFELLSSYDPTEKDIIDLVWKFGYSPTNLREIIAARRIGGTDFLSIEASSTNAYLSAYVLNALTSEYQRYNSNLQSKQSSESLDFLDSLARVKKEELDYKRSALRNFKSRNKFLNFDLESSSKLSQINEAESERSIVLSNIRRLNLSIEALDGKISSSAGGDKDVNDLKNTLTKLYERRRSGKGNYQQVMDSIKSVRRELDGYVDVTVTGSQDVLDEKESLEIELSVEQEKLDALDYRLAQLKGTVSSFAKTEATVSTMESEVALASEEYMKIQEKLNDAKNESAKTVDGVEVLVPAQPAIKPQSTGLVIKAGLTFFGVTMLSLILVVANELLDPRIKNSKRFLKMVNMDLIGSLVTNRSAESSSIFIPKMLKAQNEPSLAESIRRIRFRINSQDGKIILFTSLRQNDGKSFVIFEVAKSLSQEGRKVLIIDTNFRKSSYINLMKGFDNSEIYEVENSNSSSNELSKLTVDFQDLLIIPSKYQNVHILPNRSPSGSPSEILNRNSFEKLLKRFIELEGYDYVFLEAQGIIECSDALELSVYSDSVIFVFNTNKELTLEDKSSLEITNNLNGKVMGAILNDMQIQKKKKRA